MANHVVKALDIIFEIQLGIIIPNTQGLQTTLCCFSPNFMQLVQFHNEYFLQVTHQKIYLLAHEVST